MKYGLRDVVFLGLRDMSYDPNGLCVHQVETE
jgi:hypothetical protein